MGNVRQAVFRPEVYEVETLQQAMRVTVTAEVGTTTEQRWEKETAYLVKEIDRHLAIQPEDTVLDYGCGTGRVAKALIDDYGCRVIGVDSSKSMRALSPEYVLSERFCVWSPEVLAKMTANGFRFSKAICLWILQHAFSPESTIDLIDAALEAEALFYVLNQNTRCVPTDVGYVNDGKDVVAMLRANFFEKQRLSLPEEVSTLAIAQASSIFVLRKQGG